MKVEITLNRKNPLLKRDEYRLLIEHDGSATPSRDELMPEVAKSVKSKEGMFVIDKVFSLRGRPVSEARVLVYSKKEDIPKEKLEKSAKKSPEAKPEAKEAADSKPEAKPEAKEAADSK